MILIFLMREFFFDKVCYGSSSGKKVSAGNFFLYARIHFSKRVTAVNKKDQGKIANVFKAILEYMVNGEEGDKEKLQDDLGKLLVLLLKSYPQEFIKTCVYKKKYLQKKLFFSLGSCPWGPHYCTSWEKKW